MNEETTRRSNSKRRLRGTEGASFVEYILLVGILALGLIGGFKEARRRESKFVDREALVVKNLENITSQAEVQTLLTLPDEPIGSGRGGVVRLPMVNGGRPTANGCFAEGTLVATAEGPRAIETVREGDLLWSRDENSGAIDLRPVLVRYVTPNRPVIDLNIATPDGGEILHPTPGHPFWVNGQGWVTAEELSIHGDLWSPSGAPLHLALPSTTAVTYETVYNFEVAEYHSYFVGKSGVWVHNGPPATGPPQPNGTQGPPGKEWCEGKLVQLPPDKIASMEKAKLPLGGRYSNVRGKATEAGLGGQVNHMPAWDSLKQAGCTGPGGAWVYGSAPTVWMEVKDHRQMTSTGSGDDADKWRAEQAALIKAGNFRAALQKDIDEMRRKFGTKYDKGIEEMLRYLDETGMKCKAE